MARSQRLSEFAAIADLNKSIIQLWVVTGTFLEKQHIQIKE